MKSPAVIYIITSAVLFGISPPALKLLVKEISPVTLAGFLYLGAFSGLLIYWIAMRLHGTKKRVYLDRKDMPWLASAILTGGVLAPILLIKGISMISGFSASLLLNLEGVATALIAYTVFREYTGKSFWFALIFISTATVMLSWDSSLKGFNLYGSLLVVFSMFFWGVDNNLTRKISDRDPVIIAMTKGLVGGIISLGIAMFLGAAIPLGPDTLIALIFGAFSYGASLVLFILALQEMGAARASAFFSLAPFIGALSSILLLGEKVKLLMFPAALLMIAGALLMIKESHIHKHGHKQLVHEHFHYHDEHHHHWHSFKADYHNHEHRHEAIVHIHSHWPDTHHRHMHME